VGRWRFCGGGHKKPYASPARGSIPETTQGSFFFPSSPRFSFFFHGNETGDPPTTRRARAGDRLIFNFEVQCLLCALLNDDDSELWGYEHVVFAESTGDATIHVENVGERVLFQG